MKRFTFKVLGVDGFSHKGACICATGLYEYFDFDDTQPFDLCVSLKKLPDTYEGFIPYFGADIIIRDKEYIGSEMLSTGLDELLSNNGLVGRPFYFWMEQ